MRKLLSIIFLFLRRVAHNISPDFFLKEEIFSPDTRGLSVDVAVAPIYYFHDFASFKSEWHICEN